jgi:hypothetical protein
MDLTFLPRLSMEQRERSITCLIEAMNCLMPPKALEGDKSKLIKAVSWLFLGLCPPHRFMLST